MNVVFYDLPLYVWLILSVFLVASLMQLYYYLFVYRLAACLQGSKFNELSEGETPPLSIVMYVRNEVDNLKLHLPKILEQNYPLFEVIVVDDRSSDSTEDVLKILQKQYGHLQVRKLVPATVNVYGKGVPLGIGIKAAQYDHIVLSDANCCPDSDNWLVSLSKALGPKSKIVMAYTRSKGKLFARADRFFNTLGELSMAMNGQPYTNEGENVVFHKDLFFQNKGFNSFLHKSSKVERIFFNLVSQKDNTKVVLTPDSINCSGLSLSFREWRRNRRQMFSDEERFKSGTKNKKILEFIARAFFMLSFLFALYFTFTVLWAWISVVSLFLLRFMTQVYVFYKAQKRFAEKKLLLFSLVWDIMSMPVYLMILMSKRVK